jgi:hypothetical protein
MGGVMKYQVIDKHDGHVLTDSEILDEANRDHSDEWSNYNGLDLKETPAEVLEWIDPQYFDIKLGA